MSAADAPPAAASAPPAPLLSAQLHREMAASGLGGASRWAVRPRLAPAH
jgi:hypothetical protein